MENLPIELLRLIARNLPADDLKNLRLVSSAFRPLIMLRCKDKIFEYTLEKVQAILEIYLKVKEMKFLGFNNLANCDIGANSIAIFLMQGHVNPRPCNDDDPVDPICRIQNIYFHDEYNCSSFVCYSRFFDLTHVERMTLTPNMNGYQEILDRTPNIKDLTIEMHKIYLETMDKMLVNNIHLTELHLAGMYGRKEPTIETVQKIYDFNLPKLEKMRLTYIDFDASYLLKSLTGIRELTLNEVTLDPTFPDAISKLSQLVEFSESNSKCTEETYLKLMRALSPLGRLQSFDGGIFFHLKSPEAVCRALESIKATSLRIEVKMEWVNKVFPIMNEGLAKNMHVKTLCLDCTRWGRTLSAEFNSETISRNNLETISLIDVKDRDGVAFQNLISLIAETSPYLKSFKMECSIREFTFLECLSKLSVEELNVSMKYYGWDNKPVHLTQFVKAFECFSGRTNINAWFSSGVISDSETDDLMRSLAERNINFVIQPGYFSRR